MSQEVIKPRPTPAFNEDTPPTPSIHDQAIQMLSTYSLPEENLADAIDLVQMQEERIQKVAPSDTTDRRTFVKQLTIGTASLAACYSGLLLGYDMLKTQEDIDTGLQDNQPKPDISSAPDSTAGTRERLPRTFTVGSYAYANPDEITMLTKGFGTQHGVEIVGSDAIQQYEVGELSGTLHSGVDTIIRDNLKMIRFALRPNADAQYLRTYASYFDTVQHEHVEPIPSVFQQYNRDGKISLFLEGGYGENGAILDAFSTYVNAFSSLFADLPPFYTLRRESSDQIIESSPPTNSEEIPTEIPISANDIYHTAAGTAKYPRVKELTDVALLQIPEESENSRRTLYTNLKVLVKSSCEYLSADAKSNRPPHWDSAKTYSALDHLFHPAAYSEGNNLDISTADNTTDILASLLFLSQEQELMEEFCDRLYALHEVIEPDHESYVKPTSIAKRLVHRAIDLLRHIDPDLPTTFPRLNALYIALNEEIPPTPVPSVQIPNLGY